MEEDKTSKVKKEASSTTSVVGGGVVVGGGGSGGGGSGGGGGGGGASVSASARVPDDDGLKEEPPDFIETHCHWRECNKDFNTQDDLVKVSYCFKYNLQTRPLGSTSSMHSNTYTRIIYIYFLYSVPHHVLEELLEVSFRAST